MAQNLEFMGTWDPATGIFPVVPHDITSAYYLVTGPGAVGEHSFTEGDWLIYIEEIGTPSGSGTWYRTSGGIIQLATESPANPVTITASDIADFGEAVTAAILVDGSTIIKHPDTGELKVIGGQTTVVDDLDDDDSYVAPHTHISTDVTDWMAATRAALGPGKLNKPFFSNTAVTNAVVFTYDTKLSSVTADVKIDNQTIVKNKYGQLVAAKPLPMNISDIIGLKDYLDNYVAGFISAETQVLSANSPSNGPWQPAGMHNFGAGVKLGDALYLLNASALTLKTEIDTLRRRFEESTAATAPDPINPSIIPILDPSVVFHESLKAGTGEVIGVTLDRTPPTLPTARFYKGIFGVALPNSTLTAMIDDTNVGQILLDSSRDQSADPAVGALSIVEDRDSYYDLPSFHNLFKSIRAKISPNNNLAAGRHTYKLQEVLPGMGTFYSGVCTVDIDVPAPTNLMSISSSTTFEETPPKYFISGVPSLDPLYEYKLAPVTAERVVGYTYGKNIVRIEGKDTVLDLETDLPAASVPPAPPAGQYGNATTAPVSFHIIDEYNENVAIRLTPFNSIGVAGPAFDIYLGRLDSTFETNRVYSGDPTKLYPTDFGTPWDASKSLITQYPGELQKLRKTYRWPEGNYSSATGPNYENSEGVSLQGLQGKWRWTTLKLAEGIRGKVAFTLKFTGGNISSWEADPFTQVTSGLLIYAKLGTSGWVDCNKPYRGIGLADTNGAASMDVGGRAGRGSTATCKRVTLGPSLATMNPGDLFVRVAIPQGSSKQFTDIEVSEWA